MDTTNSTSWAPVGETPFDILNDSVNLIAETVICGVSYGVVLTLYCICSYFLFLQYRRGENRKVAISSFVYTSVMLFLGTVYIASNARTAQLSYVNDRNFPGGPAQYAMFIFYTPISIVGLVAFFGTNWMTDAILIWRLWILFKTTRFPKAYMALPCALYLTSFGMSLVTLIQSSRPNQSFWSTVAVKFALVYYSLTVAFTILCTTMMVSRIYLVRRQYTRAIGHNEHSSQYTSIAAMLVESSALYTIWAIAFLGLYIVNHPVQYVFLASLSEVQIIAPLLIIFRVSKGKAWGPSTATTLTQMNFKMSPAGGSNHTASTLTCEAEFRGARAFKSSEIYEGTSRVYDEKMV